jgi:oligosaccharide repeat unit polymerase
MPGVTLDDMLLAGAVLGVLLVILLAAKRVMGGFASPLAIYLSVWLVMIAAYCLRLVDYTEVSESTWLLIVGSMASFAIGSLVSVGLRRRAIPSEPGEWLTRIDRRRLALAIFTLSFLGAIGVGLYLAAVEERVGLEALLSRPGSIRAEQGRAEFQSEFGFGKFLNYLNFTLVPLAILYFWHHARARRAIALACIPALVAVLVSVDRTQPYFVAMWSGFLLLLLKGDRVFGFRPAVGLAAGMVLLLAVFMSVSGFVGKITENNPVLLSRSNVPMKLEPFLTPYLYLTGPLPALDRYMEVNEPARYLGGFAIVPMTKAAAALGLVEDVPAEVGPFYAIPMFFNVYTHLNVWHSDFGAPGVLVAPGIIGALTTWLYLSTRESPSFLKLYTLAVLNYCLAYTFFANRLGSTFIWEVLAVGAIVALFIRRPRRLGAAEHALDRRGFRMRGVYVGERDVHVAIEDLGRADPHDRLARRGVATVEDVVRREG